MSYNKYIDEFITELENNNLKLIDYKVIFKVEIAQLISDYKDKYETDLNSLTELIKEYYQLNNLTIIEYETEYKQNIKNQIEDILYSFIENTTELYYYDYVKISYKLKQYNKIQYLSLFSAYTNHLHINKEMEIMI